MKKIALFIMLSITAFSLFSEKEPKVELWGSAVSPYVRKVISVLEEKQIPYEWHPILPVVILEAKGEKVPEAFIKASPLGKIPALAVDDFSISDSAVISAYIERKWPKTALYPEKAEDMAQALWFEKYADTTMTDVFHKLLVEAFVKPHELQLEKDEAAIQELLEKMPPILGYLNSHLENRLFLAGQTLSIGDIAVAHHFLSLKISGLEVNLSEYPALKAYLESLFEHPSIQKAMKL